MRAKKPQPSSTADADRLPFYRTRYAALLRAARPRGVRFDRASADRVVRFFEKFLRHVKGKWAGQPFILLRWQRKLLRTVFGWKLADGARAIRTVYLEVPRKNGKSELAAGVELYLTCGDGEPAAEVYSAAADKDQAKIVFNMARRMRDLSPEIRKRTEAFKNSIVYTHTASVCMPISSVGDTKHGTSPSGNVIDELHVHKTRDLFDALTTGTGARRQPLTFVITTAGTKRESICGEQRTYAEKILRGVVDDFEFLGAVFAADDADDWTKPETWAKANPSLGVTVSVEYLASACRKAQEIPAQQNAFCQLHLNRWNRQQKRAIQLTKWDACAGVVDEAALRGARCWAGLDLASTTDVAALVHVFKFEDERDGQLVDLVKVLCRFWVPEETILERSKRDRVPYDAWARDGWITATPGNQVDYRTIREQIIADAETFELTEVGFDRWGATQITQDLTDAGLKVVPIGQGVASLSAPTKELLRLVATKRIEHGGNPVLRWMVDNVTLYEDPAGNLKPDKGKSTERIDGVVALVMALDRACREQYSGVRSVYEERGIEFIGGAQ